MAARPTFIDLRSQSSGTMRTHGMLSPNGLVSPRRPHVDGDIPPELSPLDAFALQGRLLAKQLDNSVVDGRRASRLPPTTIAHSLAQNRPGYFRSSSTESESSAPKATKTVLPRSTDENSMAMKTEVAVPDKRPVSVHPRLSGVVLPPEEIPQLPNLRARRRKSSDLLQNPTILHNAPRSLSPDPLPYSARSLESGDGSYGMRPKRSFDSQRPNNGPYSAGGLRRGPSGESINSRRYNGSGLAPPRSPNPLRHPSSIRSVAADSSDEDGAASMGASFVSLPRKLSSSSGMSGPTSPMSPYGLPPRSPSVSSEYSVGGTRAPRPPQFNFSRPLSRASRPSFDLPERKDSTDSQPYVFKDDALHTPVSINSDENHEPIDPNAPAPSYVYSRFVLPRGRLLERNSLIFTEDQKQNQNNQQPMANGNPIPTTTSMIDRPLSPPSPPRDSPEQSVYSASRSLDVERPNTSSVSPQSYSPPAKTHTRQASSPSVSSASTVKPLARPTTATTAKSVEITAEEHLAKGIECHENGSLKESTYHLRIAAKQNHPTAMLLYALACRHGWGMRPNQREGVQWLRKAADSASLEVADDEDLMKDGKPGDYLERKTRRAQFALSIYELGVSHMNGWGIEQDKVLALRCFEIAGSWGDGDAMTEAGFCYAQGVGCKKDLKKAARFYRMAEAKGVSMVGNSWIYKSKYAEKPEDLRKGRGTKKDTSAEKKPRDKSRTRTIFGRKKSIVGGEGAPEGLMTDVPTLTRRP